MNSTARNTLGRSKLVVLSATVLALTLFTARTNAQHLQQGVSVQLAPTTNATPMPDADNEDAWIVAVTADSKMYFGTDPIDPTELVDAMKRHPRIRNQNLYIKADARAPFANVERVLVAGHRARFDTPILLTSQAQEPLNGMVAPRGLLVMLRPAAGWESINVQALPSGQQEPLVKINNEEVPWATLQSKLSAMLPNTNDKSALIRADGQLPFVQVAHILDACAAAGFTAVLVMPEL